MSDSPNPTPNSMVAAPSPPRPREPGVWNPWLTIAWGVGGAVVLIAAQVVAVAIFFVAGFAPLEQAITDPKSLETNGTLLGLSLLISTPLVVGYFVFAARKSRLTATEYLALTWPRPKHALIGLAVVIAALVLADLSSIAAGHEVTSSFMNEVFFSARAPWEMVLLGLAVVVFAPLQEEIIFRGFLYPGFAKSWGAPATILITSAVWALLHVQYDWFFMGQVFVLGLVFGWIRWWSSSTLLTIVLHGTVNAAAIAEAWILAAQG